MMRRHVGLAIVVLAAVFFVGGLHAIATGAPTLEEKSEHKSSQLLVQSSGYYSLLVPLTAVPSFLAVYLNWMSMKFFVHNK